MWLSGQCSPGSARPEGKCSLISESPDHAHGRDWGVESVSQQTCKVTGVMGQRAQARHHRESPLGDLEGGQWEPQIPWPLDRVWILRTCYSEGARATDGSFPPLQGACQTCGLSGFTPDQQYHTLGGGGQVVLPAGSSQLCVLISSPGGSHVP